MSGYYYDLHVHSCLSPCADDDMTVNDIAGMASLKGIGIVALTDHNTCLNCPPFFAACKKRGVVPVAGMELTTAEEIHMVCLFESLDKAMEFESAFRSYRMKIKNKPEIFGNQYILDENDKIIGTEEFLLPPASGLSLEQAFELAQSYGSFCFPAHVDRPAGGIISILGEIPEKPGFSFIELSGNADREIFINGNPSLKDKELLINSDAHHLWAINEAKNLITLEDGEESPEDIRKRLFRYLNHKNSKKG
jgi:PHP family Zn ribbon phosphoesterase